MGFSSLRFFSTTITDTSLQDFASLCFKGLIREAINKHQSKLWTDPNFITHLLQLCIPSKSVSPAKQLHSLIITSGWHISDKFVRNHLLNTYSKIGQLQTVIKLFDKMPKRNIMSCNILINAFIQVGDLDNACKVFDEMTERNVATWNAMVAGMTQFEFNEKGLEFFGEMYELGFRPDEFTIGSVLRGCAGLRDSYAGRQVHSYVLKCGFDLNLVVGSSLAHMYMKSGSLGEGEKVVRCMPIRNVVAWNTLIAGKAQNGQFEDAVDQYKMMKMAGYKPDKITFVSVIASCSQLATLAQGQQIHAEVIKAGAVSVAVTSSLISMYSRCGCLDDSVKAFSEHENADSVLWTAMIAAYGFHGRGEEAIELFERMELEGLEANDVTFLSLLYACSHCGMKEKGLEFLELMVQKYGEKPRIEHYTCMVDLLGRLGCLDEAEAIIRSMPVAPDAIIWKTLLSACRLQRKTDMARRIGEEVLKLDPYDSAGYVLLSNINASEKRWKDVSEVRKAMRDQNVQKEPGISWLEVKNQIHQFRTGDKTHPRSSYIYSYLKELMEEIKLQGYVPDTGSVLHDMDKEEKESNLFQHSEKLAIAFALITVPPGAPIRIMKNLRVCSDCHVAIKYISEVKNREIIVRDTSRFHHFKDGKCSCGDYW